MKSMESGFGQSCRGYVLLRDLGYPKIRVLHGGFAAWRAAGLPITADAAVPTPKKLHVGLGGQSVLVDLDAMKAAIADPKIVKLDVRDVDEWIGESSSPYGKDFCPRKGRFPGAVWIEWYRMMKPTPTGQMFKSPDEILA
jgi:thiosulfate/3-mercaptopyruvate sulfurtransferase